MKNIDNLLKKVEFETTVGRITIDDTIIYLFEELNDSENFPYSVIRSYVKKSGYLDEIADSAYELGDWLESHFSEEQIDSAKCELLDYEVGI